LADESRGEVDPIPEYTRHTLKALNSFIAADFQGYWYDRASSGGGNDDAREVLSISALKTRSGGYVGLQG